MPQSLPSELDDFSAQQLKQQILLQNKLFAEKLFAPIGKFVKPLYISKSTNIAEFFTQASGIVYAKRTNASLSRIKTFIENNIQNNNTLIKNINDFTEKYLTSNKEHYEANRSFYTFGLAFLKEISSLLDNEIIPLEERINIISETFEALHAYICSDGASQRFQLAYLELMSFTNVNWAIKRVSSTVLQNCIMMGICQYDRNAIVKTRPGDQVHYVNGIMKILKPEFGLFILDDAFPVHDLDVIWPYCVNEILSQFTIDIFIASILKMIQEKPLKLQKYITMLGGCDSASMPWVKNKTPADYLSTSGEWLDTKSELVLLIYRLLEAQGYFKAIKYFFESKSNEEDINFQRDNIPGLDYVLLNDNVQGMQNIRTTLEHAFYLLCENEQPQTFQRQDDKFIKFSKRFSGARKNQLFLDLLTLLYQDYRLGDTDNVYAIEEPKLTNLNNALLRVFTAFGLDAKLYAYLVEGYSKLSARANNSIPSEENNSTAFHLLSYYRLVNKVEKNPKKSFMQMAINEKDYKLLSVLLDCAGTEDYVLYGNITLLNYACRKNDADAIRWILLHEHQFARTLDQQKQCITSALHLSLKWRCKLDVINALLFDKRSDLFVKNQNGDNAVTTAIKYYQSALWQIISSVYQRKQVPDMLRNCWDKRYKLLDYLGYDNALDQPCRDGEMILHFALKNDVDFAYKLMLRGTSVLGLNHLNESPIQIAALSDVADSIFEAMLLYTSCQLRVPLENYLIQNDPFSRSLKKALEFRICHRENSDQHLDHLCQQSDNVFLNYILRISFRRKNMDLIRQLIKVVPVQRFLHQSAIVNQHISAIYKSAITTPVLFFQLLQDNPEKREFICQALGAEKVIDFLKKDPKAAAGFRMNFIMEIYNSELHSAIREHYRQQDKASFFAIHDYGSVGPDNASLPSQSMRKKPR